LKEVIKLFDSVKGSKDFVSLCKETNIVNEISARNLYTTRNDIVHCFAIGVDVADLPNLKNTGISKDSLIRVTYKTKSPKSLEKT